ncbi:Uncharacterized protein APZ42_004004, partial [Daphnia magna]
ETAIVNAFKKVFPDIRHARCHIHAWRNIKKKFKSIGITAKPETAKYCEQFYELLDQENYEQYCASLDILQRHVWKKDFSLYFEIHIHPDMNNMGVWALTNYGVNHLLQTNRQESFNSLLKRRFVKHRGYGEEEVIEGCSKIVRLLLLRCKKAKHSAGENWLLREHLRKDYSIEDDNSELLDLDTELLETKKDLIEGISAPIGPSKKYVPSSIVLSRAKLIVLENRISLAPLQKCFSVTTHGGQKHAVTL